MLCIMHQRHRDLINGEEKVNDITKAVGDRKWVLMARDIRRCELSAVQRLIDTPTCYNRCEPITRQNHNNNNKKKNNKTVIKN
jgi:hypothetical protein